MGVYERVMADVEQRASELIAKSAAPLSQSEAISKLFRDDRQLYERYQAAVRAKAREPGGWVDQRPTPPAPTGAEAEVQKRATSLQDRTPGLSTRDAYGQVFHTDPTLYATYKAEGSPSAPTFGSELLSRELDDFSTLTSALTSTIAGIVRSEASDKGQKVASALQDFTAAVLAKLQQAGLAVPTQKRTSGLIPDHTEAAIMKSALALSPQDPLGKGMQAIDTALAEVVALWREHRGAA